MLLDKMLQTFVKWGTLKVIDANNKTHVYFGDNSQDEVCIRLHNKQIERQLLWQPELALGEGYMQGSLTIEKGKLYALLDLCSKNLALQNQMPGLAKKLFPLFSKTMRLLQQYSPLHRARRNVEHHYDLNGEFYKLFLCQDKQYSCAYFKNSNDALETAQENKKAHIAKKLLLKPGQRVLDIGCGWGGMALFLAKQYDVEVVGLTLSKEQHAVATERAKQAGLSDRVKFYLRDYREETSKFDRIVSVGMFEHVGLPQYQIFFDQAYELLNTDGIMMLHSIGSTGAPRATNAWIQKYIFPGGYCPSLSEVFPNIENSKLICTDMEILHFHYAETLKHWRERFMANWDKAKNIFNETFCRMWEYYLVSCEVGFRNQELMVFQCQLTKNKALAPMTREYLYTQASHSFS